jgi:hypothetical protein
MGGSGGFAKGGSIGVGREEGGEGESREPEEGSRTAFRRGGSVGGDTKARHKGVIHKGR